MRFDPETDIPSLEGKVILVTGGNSGLGLATIDAIARHSPSKIYLAARSRSKAEAARASILASAATNTNIVLLDLDIADFASVRKAAATVLANTDRLDILQLNAGISTVPWRTTTDGYEVQFGTNYLGHVLLTQLLMPLLLKTSQMSGADVRIIAMSSKGHNYAPKPEGICFDQLKTPMSDVSAYPLYGQSMLAKALFAAEMARRYPQITTTSLHPGLVKTNVWTGEKQGPQWLLHLVIQPFVAIAGVTAKEGVKGQLWCSFAQKSKVKNGAYYDPVGLLGRESKLARDNALAKKLWEWTEKELQVRCGTSWPASS
jgi:NAD(P)-dependent dehydrogenase (short-subunit alcohol dehydrogenase family)